METREAMMERARAKVRKGLARKDLLLIQAMRSLDEMEVVKGTLYERLQEWFKMNFPEMELQNEENYCKIVAEFGSKEKVQNERLVAIIGEKNAKTFTEKMQKSLGSPFDAEDANAVSALAKKILQIMEGKTEIEAYVSREAGKELKNLAYLTDPILAARLVETVGGLERLARMPASTIQVIGAEKALFKHLRKGTNPPKHGIIFQSGYIRGAPMKQRGKIARDLATKLAIAAKADFYTKNFIADKLKEKFEKRLKEIQNNRKSD